MMYLLAIVLPPLAVLLCGKPVQALLNVVLTLFFWIPGVIHAMLVVGSHQADQRTGRVIKAQKEIHRDQMEAELRRQQRESTRDR